MTEAQEAKRHGTAEGQAAKVTDYLIESDYVEAGERKDVYRNIRRILVDNDGYGEQKPTK